MARRSSDWAIKLLALSIGFIGFVSFLGGLAVFVSGPAGDPLGGPVYGGIVAVTGFLLLPAAVGIWRLDAWGWWLAIVCSLVSAVAILGLGPNKVGVVLEVAVLGFLVLLKDDFRIGRSKVEGRRGNRGGGAKKGKGGRTSRSDRRSKD